MPAIWKVCCETGGGGDGWAPSIGFGVAILGNTIIPYSSTSGKLLESCSIDEARTQNNPLQDMRQLVPAEVDDGS